MLLGKRRSEHTFDSETSMFAMR